MILAPISGGLFMGWALGANDSGNAFGTAVASGMISFRKAAFLCSVMVILGAALQGAAGIETYSSITAQSLSTAAVGSFAAAIAVTVMTFRSLPVSASHAMVGAITGIGLASNNVNMEALTKVLICWLLTPIGGIVIGSAVYLLLKKFFLTIPMSILARDEIIWWGLVIVGCYGAYALGANNVANVTGVFSGQFTEYGIDDQGLAIIGGIAISLGTITYSKRVMITLGSGIFKLDAMMSLVAVITMAITVHIFAVLGVPVSTSHAIVGAICGISFINGGAGIKVGRLKTISIAWLTTPLLSLLLASSGYAIFCS